jgi:ATP-dependent Lon protease
MRADGPVAVSVERGHIQFGDVRPLNQLREGQVMLIYEHGRLCFWTFLNWVHRAQETIEIRRDELARIAEQKRLKQEISRRSGLRQRQQVLTPNFRKAEDEGGLDAQGRRALDQTHEKASRFGLPLGEVLDREFAIA